MHHALYFQLKYTILIGGTEGGRGTADFDSFFAPAAMKTHPSVLQNGRCRFDSRTETSQR